MKKHLVEGPVTYDFTLHLRVRDYTPCFWRCVGTAAFGHFSFGLSQSHGHGSWLVGEVSWPFRRLQKRGSRRTEPIGQLVPAKRPAHFLFLFRGKGARPPLAPKSLDCLRTRSNKEENLDSGYAGGLAAFTSWPHPRLPTRPLHIRHSHCNPQVYPIRLTTPNLSNLPCPLLLCFALLIAYLPLRRFVISGTAGQGRGGQGRGN